MNTVSSETPLQPTTILLVEDDAPTSWRLQDALGKAGYQVRAADTLGEARAALAESAPKVLLTDLQLPDGHGVDLIRETRARFPETEIMVISILGDEESVISAITVGATGYLLKYAFPTDIAATVRDLVAGHSPISASIARFIVRRTQSSVEPPPGPPLNTAKLTPREIDILWGIAKGFPTPRSPAILACRSRPCRGISRASIASSRCTPAAKRCSRRCSRA
jgi:DNA-binding NarL/FixJ family response regulator